MADFVQKPVNTPAVRDLSVPIASVEQFDSIVEMVFDDTPFGCVEYTPRDGQTIAGVVRNREHYTAKVNFIDEETGKRVGTVSIQSPSIAAFNANAAAVMGNATLAAAMGGVAERNNARETYYCQLKCHDPSGVSKPFGLLLLLPLAMLPPVATTTSPSPARASGSRPTRTTPSGTPSRPERTPCPSWREVDSSPLHFQPAHGHPLYHPPSSDWI